MLNVSLVGKKFSCNIQLKISSEKDGGGLELVLKAGEKCSNRPQAISNVTASLNITIQRGCNNYVTKCKEMLMFLQEQALPKTMNIMKVHMVNRETKSLAQKDESRLFSCIRPSKRDRERVRDRSASRDRSSTRGYSSDSEQLYRHPHYSSTDNLSSRQSSKTDIIATPRMSRHRLKNAALLRDRKQREVSRERNELIEMAPKQQEPKTSMEIHLPVTEATQNKHKRYSVRSIETDADSQGELIYDGGSESSLRAQVMAMEDKGKGSAQVTDGLQNVQSAKVENLEKEGKIASKGVTDSDMSVDSLECLDMSSKELQETKKKKKRKVKKRVEEKFFLKEDVTSSASVVSQTPSLALPEEFQDSSADNSDTNTIKEREETLLTSSSSNLCRDVFTKISSDAAQRIVDDIIRSALKKCQRSTSTNVGNDFNDQGQMCAESSVQSGEVTDDDVIKGTRMAVEVGEITLECITDKCVGDETKDDKVLTVTSKDTRTQKCDDISFTTAEISTMSNNDKVESKLEGVRPNEEESVSASDCAMAREILTGNTNISELQKNNYCEIIKPDGEVDADDAVALAIERVIPKDPSNLQQDSSCQIKTTNEGKSNKDIEYANKPRPKVKTAIASLKSCTTVTPVVEDGDQNIEKTSLAPNKYESNRESNSSSVPRAETSTIDAISQSDSEKYGVEIREQYDDKQLSVASQPIKLYDTHMNITKRIITSVSQALHLQAHYTTSSLPTYLGPDVTLAYYTAPERGLEDFLIQEFTSNNQCASDESQPLRSKEVGKDNPQNERRRVSLRDQKSEETFQRFVQSQLFASSDKRGTSNDTRSNQDSCSSASSVNTCSIDTSSDAKPNSGYCYFVVGSDSTSENQLKFHKYSGKFRASVDEEHEDLDRTFSVPEPGGRRHGERPKSSLYRRSISEQNERKRWITSIQEPGMLKTVHQRSPSADTRSRTARNNKCVSCPALSEEDIVLEGLESHHKDVCNSLSQRTWVVLRVQEMWKAKKPLEALKMCMDLTGIKASDDSSTEAINPSNPLDTTGSKDNALFLNILLQLPSSCSTWSLSMCNLLLPELKMFISTRRHTSHVDMACNVLQVIIKKVSGVVLKVQTEDKAKPDLLKSCVSHLRDVSDRISQVLVARRGKIHTALTTEDPIALKPVLRELLSTIQTLLRIYVD